MKDRPNNGMNGTKHLTHKDVLNLCVSEESPLTTFIQIR